MRPAEAIWLTAGALGAAWSLGAPGRRRLARAQLDAALPHLDPVLADRTVRRMFHHLAAVPLEVLAATPVRTSHANDVVDLGPAGRVRVLGRHHVDAVREQGRGALLLSAHLGNFELALLAEAASGLPLTVLTKALSNRRLDALWRQRRGAFGVEPLADDHSLSAVIRALDAGRCVAMTLDQHANREHAITVSFMGRAAAAHRSLALLSARCRVAVVPAFARRIRPGLHELCYQPAIPFDRTLATDPGQALALHTQRYTDAIEAAVRATPEQWTWLHRRWKLNG